MPQQRKRAWLTKTIIIVASLGVLPLWAAKSPWWGLVFESSLDQTQARQVFHEVQREKLVPDAAGQVTLPAAYSTLTRDGHIYVTRKGDLLLVLFPTWRGKGTNVAGYLWCNRPLVTDDFKPDEYGQFPTIEVWGPGLWDAMAPPHHSLLLLETPLDAMPYYVSRQLD